MIRAFPWPKSMRWGARSAPADSPFAGNDAEGAASLRWVRPLRSILCTFGPETEEPIVVPISRSPGSPPATHLRPPLHGAAASRSASAASTIIVPELEAAKVVLDHERRQAIIETEAKNLAFAQGLEVVEDVGLLEEVAGLVEWPVVLMGRFDEAFLAIPEEVIRLTIRAEPEMLRAARLRRRQRPPHEPLPPHVQHRSERRRQRRSSPATSG